MQCKDIPTLPILEFLSHHEGKWCNWATLGSDAEYSDKDKWTDRSVQNAVPPGTPEKVVIAKMRIMIKRGFVDGCGCGCRGDFELTKKGLEFIGQAHAAQT